MNLFELAAKITLDSSEYERGLSKAASMAQNIGGKIGGAVSTIAKISTTAVGAAATGIGAVVKQSVSAFGEYEQLKDGVKTLFGDAAGKVLADSERAFTEAGMSMNQYMETSIQSAASLINSLDGDQAKAAELMNVSIKDMADNVNKMGTTMEAVQNAYRGFSRGNFTMLDNLALGFAGTKEGMQDLLKKANEINKAHGKMSDYAIDSYADIVEAIHVVQEEMGVTGTTAAEAAGTIQGSAASVKAAWQNLVTGLGNKNANLKKLTKNLVDAVGTAAKNLVPVIKQSLDGIGEAIQELAPVLTDAFGDLIVDVAPDLVRSAISLVKTIGKTLVDNANEMLDAADEIIDAFLSGFVLGDGDADNKAGDLIGKLGDFIIRNIDKLAKVASSVVDGLVQFLDNEAAIADLADAAVTIIVSLATGLSNNVSKLLPAATKAIVTFVTAFGSKENLETITTGGSDIVDDLTTGIKDSAITIADAVPVLLKAFFDAMVEQFPEFLGTAIGGIGRTIHDFLTESKIGNIVMLLGNAWAGNEEGVEQYLDKLQNTDYSNPSIYKGIVNFGVGLQKGFLTDDELAEKARQIKELGDTAEDTAQRAETAFQKTKLNLDPTPATGALQIIDEKANESADLLSRLWSEDGLLTKFSSGMSTISGFFKKVFTSDDTSVIESISTATETATGKAGELKTNITEAVSTVTTGVETTTNDIITKFTNASTESTTAWQDVPSKFGITWGEIAAAFEVTDATTWGSDMVQNFINGVNSKMDSLRTKINEMAGLIKNVVGFSEPKEGPLSDFHTYAPDMMELFMQGITDNEQSLRDRVYKAFDFGNIGNFGVESMRFAGTGNVSASPAFGASVLLDAIQDLRDAIINRPIELDGEIVAGSVTRRQGDYYYGARRSNA